ncbi:helix-turn-helix domain-containing protein [Schleiferilactobacillus harbinensis]|uniref:helix-turn-helix domain-containing protein n=1 Tax=Schleiferilactobacillus harbinensis TaxID=304207 RepID=UPI0011BDC46D|nr:helix-turn-helix domain-containing protein [Schleiferilactobacillus harbinensis]
MARLSRHPELLEQIIALEKVHARRGDPRWLPINEAIEKPETRPRRNKRQELEYNPDQVKEWSRAERLKVIDKFLRKGYSPKAMSKKIGLHQTTINRELRIAGKKPYPRAHYRGYSFEHDQYYYFSDVLEAYAGTKVTAVLNGMEFGQRLSKAGWIITKGLWLNYDGSWHEGELPE